MADIDSTDRATPSQAQEASSRRALLRGAALMGVGLPVLAACGSDESSGDAAPTSANESSSTGGGGGGGGGGGEGAAPIATTADVPEGGGLILQDDGVVITQPAAGEFKGFSSTCTHQGCPVDNVSDGTINCICHGSKFSIEDGSVAAGPATSPLPEQPISVKGDDITLA